MTMCDRSEWACNKEYWTTEARLILLTGVRGGLPYERGGDARRKFCLKPLKETNLGVA